jgi:uncharacterized cupredoxin-like copper-binding protein
VNRRSIILACISLAAGAATLTPIATAGKNTAHAAASVAVSGKEYSFSLSSTSAGHGRITFRFSNRGKIGHDFKIDGKMTPVINPGKTATFTVSLKKGTYGFLCTVPGHAQLGMKGTFRVK